MDENLQYNERYAFSMATVICSKDVIMEPEQNSVGFSDFSDLRPHAFLLTRGPQCYKRWLFAYIKKLLGYRW
jgi:hypothetical protein